MKNEEFDSHSFKSLFPFSISVEIVLFVGFIKNLAIPVTTYFSVWFYTISLTVMDSKQ